MTNEEKQRIVKANSKRLVRYSTFMKFLVGLLIFELLLLWLLNPQFIPPLEKAVTWLRDGIVHFLLPENAAELETGTYRTFIYNICETIKSQPFYPTLSQIAKWIIPTLMVILLIASRIVKSKLETVSRDPVPRRRRKHSKRRRASAPIIKRNAMTRFCTPEAQERFEQLQNACKDPFAEGKDWGLWVRTTGAAETDVILPWRSNGTISVTPPNASIAYEFKLKNRQAYITTADGDSPLEAGVPLVIAHPNNSKQEVIDMTVIWLGGNPV